MLWCDLGLVIAVGSLDSPDWQGKVGEFNAGWKVSSLQITCIGMINVQYVIICGGDHCRGLSWQCIVLTA